MPTKSALKTVTRDVGPLSLRASFQPETVDAEKRTVELVASTGARVLRNSWIDGRFWEELSLDPKHVRMGRLESGRSPLLNSHDSYGGVDSILGVVESAKIEGKQLTCVVRFPKAEDDPDADRIFRKVQDGIISNVSVGYRVYKTEKTENAAEEIPVLRVVDWEPHEVSLVSMGADAGAGTRSAEIAGTNPCEFVTREECTMEGDAKTTPTGDGNETKPATAPVVDEAARAAEQAKIREEATRAERERVEGIRALGAQFKGRVDAKFIDEQISGGKDLQSVRNAVLEQLAKQSDAETERNHIGVEVGEGDREKFLRAAEAAIIQRAMLGGMIESAKKRAAPGSVVATKLASVPADAGQFRAMDFVELSREFLERSGVKTRGMDKSTLVGLALTHRSGGMASTSDFAVLLENVTNKSLLAAYATSEEDTWRQFCGIRPVQDFKVHNLYRTGSFGSLDAVNEHGEYKSKAIPDGEKATISVGSYGNIIAITRKALMNDDLGAFNSLAVELGQAAARTIENAVYALLALNSGLGPTQADNSPFFDGTARSNVGAGAALSVAAIDADAALMASQKDPSGNKYLNLQPYALLVPRTLKSAANLINEAEYDPDANYKVQKPNTSRGMFEVVVATPRLTGTRRYVFANPAVHAALAVAFLDGQEAPTVQSREGWRVDGTEMKVSLDFGVAAIDYRAAVTDAGASAG
jgi:HK97 family phage prohead protease